MHGHFSTLSCQVLAWPFNAKLLHRDHHGADELIAALKSEKLILPIRLVKEDHIQGNGIGFKDRCQFRKNIFLILAVLTRDKFQ
jgi:hypothetical protein